MSINARDTHEQKYGHTVRDTFKITIGVIMIPATRGETHLGISTYHPASPTVTEREQAIWNVCKVGR